MTAVESLVALLVRADASSRMQKGMPAARFRQKKRKWFEPFFNAIGHLLGQLLYLLPNALRRRAHRWMCSQMAQHADDSFPGKALYQAEAVTRAQALYRQTGHWPAVLFLTSHPETTGDSAWLRFELLRQGLWIAEALESAAPHQKMRSHPRCFLAIDPYALDSVPTSIGAMYAGLMHSQYLVWDRQPSTQSWLQRHGLLAGTGHDRIAWRLLKAVRQNPLLLVLAGGLPANARLFYAVREWASALQDTRRILSKHHIRWRVMSLFAAPTEGVFPTETGNIPPAVTQELQKLLAELGYALEERDARLAQLATDFRSPVPMRLRLWNMLYARLARRGVPLLVLPLTHAEQAPHIKLGPYFEMTEQTDVAAFAQGIHAFYANR